MTEPHNLMNTEDLQREVIEYRQILAEKHERCRRELAHLVIEMAEIDGFMETMATAPADHRSDWRLSAASRAYPAR